MDDILNHARKNVLLTTIEWDDKNYILNSSISFCVIHEGEFFTISYEPLGIEIFERSLEDALESFNEEFAMLWKLFAQENDKNLSGDAILLKQTLLNFVSEVR